MPLTIKEVKNAKVGRHSDGSGLYMLVKPTAEWVRIKAKQDRGETPTADEQQIFKAKPPGAKTWVLRVQLGGKRKDYGIGSVTLEPISTRLPVERKRTLTLSEAREKARIGREMVKAGVKNLAEYWRTIGQEDEPPRSFQAIAEECHSQALKGWKNGKHRDEWLGSLQRYAFPEIGDLSPDQVDATAIQRVLLPIWLEKPETARRVKQRIGAVLDYAAAKGLRATEAPMRGVKQLLKNIKQPERGNMAAMPYSDVPAFMARLRCADASIGRLALQFLILTAARAGAVRGATWGEIDLEAALWRIEAGRPLAKLKKPHTVPLVPAAVAILKEVRGLFPCQPDDFVFPGIKGMLSDATMNKVLREHGGGDATVHGFRSAFRDWVAESISTVEDSRERKVNAGDVAEAALAHELPNRVEAAYRRTKFLEHRRDGLMPAWSSFVLHDDSNVVSLAERRA